MLDSIVIKGARVHNLRNINTEIPRDRIVVITGPSGSGKSSLAFDTIYAEGQRRYVESLSAYARQFLENLQKPDVDSIEGLSPSIAIEQKKSSKSLRSTVGTVTEIYDYLRVAFTRIGKIKCYRCGTDVATQNVQQIIDSIVSLPQGTRIQVLAPIVMGRKGEYRKELQEARSRGFIRARIDGEIVDITGDVKLTKQKRHDIAIVIDRLIIKPGIGKHISEAVTLATGFTDTVLINIIREGKDIFFSTRLACPRCGINYPEISPRFFSFNSPYGACPQCNGLGYMYASEEEDELSGLEPCEECSGRRIRKEALAVRIRGKNIAELALMPVRDLLHFLDNLALTDTENLIVSKVLKEARERLVFLNRTGLGYLSLDRPAATLSSGEEQRIRLATQIGASLSGVLYIFDEPTIGLHPRDCGRLLDSLRELKEQGNSVLVVEHDEETMRMADHIIDMGPGAGTNGGRIVSSGTLAQVLKDENSLTGAYLRGDRLIHVPAKRRSPSAYLTIKGAKEHNLKNIDVRIPLGVLTCVTGVSGSGKSTLVLDILYRALARKFYAAREMPGRHTRINGMKNIDRVIDIDQRPLGRTPRSNPATYTGLFSYIRNLFSRLPESRIRGYGPGRFSFNVEGGRCEECRGDGLVRISMHFLPDVYVPCDTCRGRRYNRETLDIRYGGETIADVLGMTISEAAEFFANVPPLRQRLTTLDRVGLGYMQLGQSATTLSGGEAQRVKLSRELGKRATGRTLFILDEPTTGLHFVDIQHLLDVLSELVDAGNSVVIIEHNLDVIKCADHIIDMGPGSGEDGGEVVACGTPEEVAENPESYTGRYLREKLGVRSQESRV